MTDIDRLGVFSYPGSIDIEDEYTKPSKQHSRYGGKQMVVQGDVLGNLPDAMIDKNFKRLSENDVYIDPGSLERRERAARKERNVSEKAFLPSSPAKKSSGKGTYYGCISPAQEYMHDNDPDAVKPPPDTNGPKNFLCSPAKKGGYGTTGTSIGHVPEYESEPYLNSRILEKDERIAAREKIVKPFVSSGRGGGLFHTDVYAYEPGPVMRERTKPPPIEKAFKSPGKGKSGHNCTLSAFPEYMPDPFEEREAIEKAEKAAAKPPGIFKPGSVPKSLRQTTINPFKLAARPSRHGDI